MTMDVAFGMSSTGVVDIADRARRLEQLGFDYVGVGEHVAFRVPTMNPFVALAAAGAVTERIRLLTSVNLTPIYPPALLAKMAAALDVVSDGRLVLGVGIGGEIPADLESCGVPLAERGARATEALSIVRRLWTEDDVTVEGRFTRFSDVTLDLKPVSQPHPPIWVSGRTEAAMRRAAHLGDGWMPYMYTPEMLASSIGKIQAWAEEAGRPADAVRPTIFVFVSCHPDRRVALERVMARLGAKYAQDFTAMADRYLVVGTAAECQARLREYVEAGATAIIIGQACDDSVAGEHDRRLAEEVLPAFR
jgi:probable F420-dependent oxidoreductase